MNSFFNHSSSAPSPSTVLLLTKSLKQTESYLTLVKLTVIAKTKADWLYNHRHRSFFREMHPNKAGGCTSRVQNRGVSGPKRNRIYISINWNF